MGRKEEKRHNIKAFMTHDRANKGLDEDGNVKPQWVNAHLSKGRSCITEKIAKTIFRANTDNKTVNRFFSLWMNKKQFSVTAGFHSSDDKGTDRAEPLLHLTIKIQNDSFHVYIARESLRAHWKWRDVKITGISGPGFHSKRARNQGRWP